MPLYFLLAAALVAVDQVVKYLVRAGIPLHTAVDFLPGLDLTYVQNTGAAFSLFTGHTWLLTIISLAVSVALAAALIMLTPWKSDRILVDPFCGSGTFPIEAAMIAANMAPGMNRSFLSESWTNLIPKKCWYDAIDEATEMVDDTVKVDIQGYDIDGEVIKAARENAERAGVDHMIHFQERPVAQLSHPKKYGFIITNPPYGERIEEKKNLPALYKTIGERFKALDSWSMYLITAYEDAERYIGRKADKNRKIYNGMMKTYYYQFMGPKPPRRKTGDQVEA